MKKRNQRMQRNLLELFIGWLVAMGYTVSWNNDGSVTMSAHFMNNPALRNVTVWIDMRMNKGATAMYQDFIAGIKEASLEAQQFLKVAA